MYVSDPYFKSLLFKNLCFLFAGEKAVFRPTIVKFK